MNIKFSMTSDLSAAHAALTNTRPHHEADFKLSSVAFLLEFPAKQLCDFVLMQLRDKCGPFTYAEVQQQVEFVRDKVSEFLFNIRHCHSAGSTPPWLHSSELVAGGIAPLAVIGGAHGMAYKVFYRVLRNKLGDSAVLVFGTMREFQPLIGKLQHLQFADSTSSLQFLEKDVRIRGEVLCKVAAMAVFPSWRNGFSILFPHLRRVGPYLSDGIARAVLWDSEVDQKRIDRWLKKALDADDF